MTQINHKFVELHTPLFVGGTNLGVKLDPSRRTGLRMVEDLETGRMYVLWNGELAVFPVVGNVANTVPYKRYADEIFAKLIPPETEQLRVIQQVSHPMVAGAATSAQVETPSGHVHAGPGKGKTGTAGKMAF